ncbi:hypothetical protein [Gimesia aquarii]|nr:hypothetical protein [Gimesia aquarii]
MPIKFRCQHCDQLMGISRSKAGEIVDCPTCGLSVRVPGLDGQIAPIPQPKLNLKDSELSNALDELASIGTNVTLDKQVNSDHDPDLQIPNSTAPEPQVKEPSSAEAFKAIPVREINHSALVQQVEEINPTPMPATPVAPVNQSAATDQVNPTDLDHEHELTNLASLAQKRAADMLVEKKKARLKRSAKYELPTGTWVIILITFAALTFSIGLLVGRNMSNVLPAAPNATQN